ncbi:Protein ApaG [Galdieria sulphuraria]|nr:Protein ApaG [Galdieria sulphuraria]
MSLLTKLEENAISISKSRCSESANLGSWEFGNSVFISLEVQIIANLAAARTLLPGVDDNCIVEHVGNELPADLYCLYRLCSGQYIPSDYSQFQGILGGYLFYDVLVDCNLSSVCSMQVSELGNRRILKIGQDMFWYNNRGSQGLFIDLETKHVIELTQNHYVIASNDIVTYLEKYVNDLSSNSLMVDRNTKQILRFCLCPTYSGYSDVVTGYIRIQATCLFVPGISKFSHFQEQDEFVFAYRIRISMLSSAPSHYMFRLEQRHWIVTDTDGHVENIRGPGVIGEHPIFHPGSVFDYASCAPLRGPVGKMKGSFTFRPLHHEPGSEIAAPFIAQVGELHLNIFERYRFPPDSPERYLQLQKRWERDKSF